MAAGDRVDRGEGPVPAGTAYLSQSSDPAWTLEVDGQRAARRTAFGWANAFEVPVAGEGSLRYDSPLSRPALVALQAVLWLLAARIAWVGFASGERGPGRRQRGRRPSDRRRRGRRGAAPSPSPADASSVTTEAAPVVAAPVGSGATVGEASS
jgi:hypothetical protein